MSELKVIKTEQEYDGALARVSMLMAAAAGSAGANELEVLVTLIESHEAKDHPIDLPTPIEAIKFRMEQANLSQQDLVPFIGSRSKVSEVLSGKRGLNLGMIRRLHDSLGIPLASLVGKPALPDLLTDELIKQAPVAEMAKRGWFSGFSGSGREARTAAPSLLRSFFGPNDLAPAETCLHRQKPRRNTASSPAALSAWRTRVLQIAATAELPAFDRRAITLEFARQLVGLSLLDSGPRAAGEYLAKHGIALVVLAHLPGTHLDGCATRLKGGAPVIGLTLRYDRLDHFWFTLLHELGHVALHLTGAEDSAFLDDLDGESPDDARETEADAFASDSLISSHEWVRAKLLESPTPDNVRLLAAQLRIHPAIVAGRVRRELGNFRLLSGLVESGLARRLFPELQCGMLIGR